MAASAKDNLASDVRSRELPLTEMVPRSVFQMVDLLVGVSVDSTRLGQASREALAKVGFSPRRGHVRGFSL